MEPIHNQIAKDIQDNKIMLYIKGDKGAPQCGFSAAVLRAFDQLGANYQVRNVLTDPALREGIKSFTKWPTIPQVFINGEFIGGCDITLEMFKSGELAEAVQKTQNS